MRPIPIQLERPKTNIIVFGMRIDVIFVSTVSQFSLLENRKPCLV